MSIYQCLAKFVPCICRNCYFRLSGRNSDTAVGFGDHDLVHGRPMHILAIGFVILYWPLTLWLWTLEIYRLWYDQTLYLILPKLSNLRLSCSDLKIETLGPSAIFDLIESAFNNALQRPWVSHSAPEYRISTQSGRAWLSYEYWWFCECQRLFIWGRGDIPMLSSQSWWTELHLILSVHRTIICTRNAVLIFSGSIANKIEIRGQISDFSSM